jgi:C-terminal processing protease CtpA/Prc
MPSLLDKVKSKLGLSKDNFTKISGHTLGRSSNSVDNFYEVTFTENSLGLTIHSAPPEHAMSGSPIVVDVTAGSAASAGGVHVGDIIVSMESNSGQITYGDFVEIVQAIGRPMTLRFQRGIGSKDSRRSGVPLLSNEEREARRQAMREAALAREKAWDKRVSSAASTRRRYVSGIFLVTMSSHAYCDVMYVASIWLLFVVLL